MKKIFWILTLLLSLGFSFGCCATGAVGSTQHPTIQNAEHIRDAVVALTTDDGDVYCSGVWLTKEYFVTAHHCVSDEEDQVELGTPVSYTTYDHIKLTLPQSAPYRNFLGIVVAEDDSSDLALVKSIHDIPHHIAELDTSEELLPGMPVQIMGHTIGLEYTYMEGVVSAVRHVDMRPFMPHNTMMVHITSLIGPGNSGGGAFDEHGHLIGIASFHNKRTAGAAFFVHRDKVAELLSTLD